MGLAHNAFAYRGQGVGPLSRGNHPISPHCEGELQQVPWSIHRLGLLPGVPVLLCQLVHAARALEGVGLVEAGLPLAPQVLLPQAPVLHRQAQTGFVGVCCRGM